MGKKTGSGMSHYNPSIGKTFEDVLRIGLFTMNPAAYSNMTEIPAALYQFHLQNKPAVIPLSHSEKTDLISSRPSKPTEI
jgi:hypothetical protein